LRLPTPRWIALAVFGVIFAATWWRPQWPVEQSLHHSLTVVALIALLLVQQRLPFSSFVLVLAFLLVHTVAARWIYSFVPYDQWTQAIFGWRLDDVLGWQRNNFDRLVHLSYGLLVAPVLFRFFLDRGWRRRWAALSAVDIIVSTGALYELLEWGVAVTLAPGYAEAYNGQQGDVFDPQQDMAIALLGAIIGTVLALVLTRSQDRHRMAQERVDVVVARADRVT
jgi:putative membrane protein